MSTHNIPVTLLKKKISLNYHKYDYGIFFQGTQEGIRNSPGKRAIIVGDTEGLLYSGILTGINQKILTKPANTSLHCTVRCPHQKL